MEPYLAPAVRPFEVWFVPGDRTPMRIGQKRATYDDALTLAEVASCDLSGYGYAGSEVLVMWNTSVLKTLSTASVPTHPAAPCRAPVLLAHAGLRGEVARLVLEDLLRESGCAEPNLAAPPDWIERMDSVLRVIATPADQRRYRLDGLHCVTNEYLHRRVAAVLRQFERLVAGDRHLPLPADDELRLTL
jgi:hypothetical protein